MTKFASITVLLGVLSLILAGTAAALPLPTFTGLPANGDGSPNNYPTTGWGINASGQAVGYGTVRSGGMDPGHTHAWIYSSGTMTDINTWGVDGTVGATSQAFGINNSGTVVGVALDAATGINENHAFASSGNSMMDLNAGDATVLQSRAYGVNSSGAVVGQAYWATNQWHAVNYSYGGTYNPATGVYSGGSWSCTDINTLVCTAAGSGSGGASLALAINDAGTVTGMATAQSGMGIAWNSKPQAYVLSGGTVTILPAPSGMDSTQGWAINAKGDVGGQTWSSTDSGTYSAMLAVKGPGGYTVTNLGQPAGHGSTYGYGMNNYDMVVGNSYNNTTAVYDAYLWNPGNVPFYGLPTGAVDLTALVAAVPGTSGWVLNTARSINDAGQIIGSGHHNGTDDYHSFPFIITLPKALPGDANVDGKVDSADMSKVLTNYNKTGVQWTDGDFDGSGTVDLNDLSKVLTNYDKTAATSIKAVPEPSTIVLLAAGLWALLVRTWRKWK